MFLLLLEPLLQALAYIVNKVEDLWTAGQDSVAFNILVLALTAGALVVPPLGGWLVSKLMRRFDRGGRLVIAYVVLALAVAVLVIEQLTRLHERPFWVSALVTVGGIVALLLLTYLGAGSILAWAARRAVSQVGAVGTLASKALPLLMIVILLSFFTEEIWRLVDPDRNLDRQRLWLVVGFFAALGVLFLSRVVIDEMKDLDRQRRADGAQQLRARLTGTPFAGLVADDHDTSRHPLSRGERANVVLVFFFAQAVQVVFFAFLVFVFFVVFGSLAINESLLQDWVGHQELTDGRLFGLQLPVPDQLVQMSIFLSAFSGLYFAGAAATDPAYRDTFFDPLLAEIRVSLSAREAYLAQWGTEHIHEH